jgi:hypothetical protein
LYLTNLNNIAIGNNTLNAISSSTPQSNIAIGTDALRYGQPVASAGIGYQALSISNGQFCVGVGHRSGLVHTNGTGCTYIGAETTASTATINNEMALGYLAVGKGANTISLGSSSSTTLYTPATVRSDTGTLTLNSQGGALNLQSAGTTYASVSSTGITSANFNGKLSIVGGTTNAGNLVYCNNGTNTTGNFDLLTDSNQHLTFSGGSGVGSNVLSVGGATNGSIVVPSTAGTITAPTVNATTVVNTNVITATGSNTIRLKTSDATYSTYISSAGSFPTGTQAGYFIHSLSTGSNLYSYSNIGGSGTAIPMNFQASEYNYQGGASGTTQIVKLRSNNGYADRLTPTQYQIQIPSSVGSLNMGAFYTGGVGFTSAIQSWDSAGSGVGQQLLINHLGGEVQIGANTASSSIVQLAGGGGITNYTGGSHLWFNINDTANYSAAIYYAVATAVYPRFVVNHPATTTGGTSFHEFCLANVIIGSITQNGTTGVLFNATSDHRLKSNVKPIDTSLLQKLKPCSFTWIQDNRDDIGFIAHEFAEVFPDSVINQKDEVDESGKPKYQQMSNSVCIPLLVSCVQEQQQRISSLEAQLASLKAIVDSLVAGK